MDDQKARYARHRRPHARRYVAGADMFLGLSAAGVLKPEMVEAMAEKPLILALANPDPEIRPRSRRSAARRDHRHRPSDYPNQVNNVLCFPFIFRGALDVGATTINEEMKLAAVRAIAELARPSSRDVVAAAYETQDAVFGPDHLIPKTLRPEADHKMAPAVAQAAMDSGVATRPLPDLDAYRDQLQQVRLHVRHGDAAGLRRRGQASRAGASCTPRARTSASCARRSSSSTRDSRSRFSSAGRRSSRAGIKKLGLDS